MDEAAYASSLADDDGTGHWVTAWMADTAEARDRQRQTD